FSGGDFWRGAAQSGLIVAFNHSAHDIFQDDPIKAQREALAKWSEEHWRKGSTKWAYNADPAKTNKCNIFVYDGLVANDMSPYSYARLAGDWGNPDVHIPGYEIVTTPERGDIGAFKHSYQGGATGHMGIMRSSSSIVYTGSERVSSTRIAAYKTWAVKTWV